MPKLIPISQIQMEKKKKENLALNMFVVLGSNYQQKYDINSCYVHMTQSKKRRCNQEIRYKYFLGNDTFYFLFIYLFLMKDNDTFIYLVQFILVQLSFLWEMTREISQEYQKYSKSNGHMQDVTTQPLSVSWGTNFFYTSEDLLASLLKYKRSFQKTCKQVF